MLSVLVGDTPYEVVVGDYVPAGEARLLHDTCKYVVCQADFDFMNSVSPNSKLARDMLLDNSRWWND